MNNYRVEVLHFTDNSVSIKHATGRVRSGTERTRDAKAPYRAHLNSKFYAKARLDMLKDKVEVAIEGLSKNQARRDKEALIRYFKHKGMTVNNK